jgi:hypothetical protein
MIKFFRHIRQRMLNENRFSRYFLYAIGEIVLVVIGILIALGINSASAEARTRNKEVVLLKEMRQNLQADLLDMHGNVEGNLRRIHANEMVLKALQNRTALNDTLKQELGNVWGNYQLGENTAAWENLKSVGIDLISNDSLRSAIAALYSTKYAYLDNLEKDLDNNYQWSQLYPMVLKHLNLEAMWVSATPVDHEAMLNDREFQEVLKMNLFIRGYMQSQYEMVDQEIKTIVEQIDRHNRFLEGHQ